jgi:hypothetical protein
MISPIKAKANAQERKQQFQIQKVANNTDISN